jgi:hypothetical protein
MAHISDDSVPLRSSFAMADAKNLRMTFLYTTALYIRVCFSTWDNQIYMSVGSLPVFLLTLAEELLVNEIILHNFFSS